MIFTGGRKFMEEEAGEQRRKKVQRSFFPHPDPAAAVTASASLCHISLRRSSQRLAGGVWPGSPSRRESWAEASARRSPGALPAERPRTSLASIAGGESGSRWGVGLPAPLLALRCPHHHHQYSDPREVGEATRADFNCQPAPAEERRARDRGRGVKKEERREDDKRL